MNTFSYQFKQCSVTMLLVVAGIFSAYSQNTTTSPTITSGSGNYVVPAGITKVTVQAWGGGGGGGGVNGSGSADRAGGGGAGGSFTLATSVTVAPGNVAYSIGAGGTVGSNASGGTGGTTTFSSSTPVTAVGGAGGTLGTGGAGNHRGAGGGVTTGVTRNGGSGAQAPGDASNASGSGAGGGGAGAGGNGGNASGTTAGTAGTGGGGAGAPGLTAQGNGTAGTAPGGGGSGGFDTSNNNRSGGLGAAGQLIISYIQATSAATYTAPIVRNGTSQTITVTFSEAVSGTPKITLTGSTTGAIVTDQNMTGSGTTWTFTHSTWSVATTETVTVTVNTAVGTVAAAGLGNVVFPTPTTNTFLVDNVPPAVTAHSITNAAAGAFDYNITLDDAGTTYYEVTNSATPPTAIQIKAGTGPGHQQSGNFAVPTAGVPAIQNITGLGIGTFYIYSVSEDAIGNQSTPIVVDNTTFACVAPTTQATAAATPFTNVKAKSMTYTWVRGNGTAGVVVLIKQGSAPTAPVSGVVYTGVNSDFSAATDQGGGTKVAYQGTGTTVTVTNLAPLTDYHFAVYEYNTTNTCYMLTTPLSQNNSTIAIANETALSAGTGAGTIPSTAITSGAAVNAFVFQAADAGTDGERTRISQMTFKPAGGNFFGDFTQLIAGAELYDNAGNGPAGTVTIAAGTIQVASIPNGAGQLGDIADAASKTYTLKVWLNGPFAAAIRTTADGEKLILGITDTDVQTVAGAGGMSGSSTNSGAANGVIDVTATRLLFIQGASNVVSGVAMSPAVTLEAVDAQGNRDTGFVSSVGITSTGTLSVTPVNATYVAGVGTYSSIIHTATATGRQLTTNSGTLTNPTSGTFNITASNASNIIADGTFTYPQNIAYETYQEASDITNSGTSIVVGRFLVQDGGGAADADNLTTTLSSLTLNLGANFNYIRRIALYNAAGTTEISTEQAVSSATVVFSGLNIVAPDDGSIAFTVRVSFKSIVADNQFISFTVSAASTSAGTSTFAAANAGGATTSVSGDNNRIEVNASKYLFVTQPTNTAVGVTMSPSPVVEAVDAFNNRDVDYTSVVGLESTGTLSSTPQNATFSAGLGTYSSIVHTVSGSGLVLSTNSGTLFNANSNPFQIVGANSDIIENTTFSYPSYIAYAAYQENTNIVNSATSLLVAKFDIRDGGNVAPDPDTAPTILTNLSLNLGPNYGIIRRIALYDAAGTTEIPGSEQVVGSQTVVFGGLTLTAPDNGILSFTVRVSFTTAVNDHDAFTVTVSAATAQAGNSLFAAANAGGATTSTSFGENTVDVIATKLRFVQQPTNTLLNFNMTPNVTIETADGFNNRDVDYTTPSNLSLGSSGSLSSLNPFSFALTNGFASFPTIVHTVTGTGLTLTATNPYGLTNAISNTFNITASNASNIIADGTFIVPQNIAYQNYQSANISALNSIIVGRFIVQDGGGASDGDLAPTNLTGITLDLGSNFNLIRNIAIYNASGISELAEIPVTTQLATFTGLAINAPDDGTATFTVRVTFNSTVTDNLQFAVAVNAATVQGGVSSTFAAANAGGAAVSTSGDNNRIEVTATQLIFTQDLISFLLPNIDVNTQQANPVIRAQDIFLNTDLDYTTSLTLSAAIPFTPTAPIAGVAGIYNFPAGFKYTTTGNGRLTATSGVLPPKLSAPVTVQAGSATRIALGTAAPATISSVAAANTPVFNFTVQDDGPPIAPTNNDGLPTLISDLTFTANSTNNNIDWTEAIQSAQLTDGTNVLNTTNILPTQIIFNSIPTAVSGNLGWIDDDATKTYTLRITLKSAFGGSSPVNIDGKKFEFEVIQSNISLAANSTNIIPGQSATSGNRNQVTVVATALHFISPSSPSNISLNTPFPSAVTVEAVDSKGNRDLDFSGAAGRVQVLTNTTNQSTSSGPVMNSTSFTSGLLTLNSLFKFTTGTNGDLVTLTMGAGPNVETVCNTNGLICGTSPTLTLLSSFESQIKADPAYPVTVNVPYIQYQATNIASGDIASGTGSYELARLLLSDGDGDGVAGDVDGASTVLTSIRLRITNSTGVSTLGHIRNIAIYNSGLPGATELAEIAVNSTDLANGYVTITGLNIIAPDDNIPNPAVISVRVSFNSTASAIIDKTLLQVRVADATLGGGSAFYAPTSSYIAGVFNGYQAPTSRNFVNVIASKLDFTTQPPAFAGINEPLPTIVVKARDQFNIEDVDFNGPANISAAAIPTGSFSFVNGTATITGLRYTNPGNGTLVVSAGSAPVLFSNTNNPGATPPNVAIPCTNVNVVHVSATVATGGVTSSTNLIGGTTINTVIYGVTFSSQNAVAGEPSLKKFVISFSNPVTGVLYNFRVFESLSNAYTTGLPDVTTLGGVVTSTANDVTVTFGSGQERSLAGGTTSRSYFLMVDVDALASGSTPSVQPFVEDLGFGTPTDTNIGTTRGTATASKSQTGGITFTFASIFPPTITSSIPAKSQLNVSKTQSTISLTFSVPIWSLDSKIILHDQENPAITFTCTTTQGKYNPLLSNTANKPTLAQPIVFNIPSTLLDDHVYYVTIAAGDLKALTGIMDENNNVFPGISYPGELYFKTAKLVAPQLLGVLTSPIAAPSNPSITNITTRSATINAIFDQPGTAHYMVLPAGSIAPTNAQIDGATYSSATVHARGTFPIKQISPSVQSGLVTPSVDFVANQYYEVWMYAENDALPATVATSAPFGGAPNFAVGGTGPTIPFPIAVPAFDANVNLNNPSMSVCNNSYQILSSPIVITEGTDGQFFTGAQSGPNFPSKSINFVLPAGFQFDVSQTGGVPTYGTLLLEGNDFHDGSLSFLGNSILTLTFSNYQNTTLDRIIISGLRVISSGSSSGAIFRLGGGAIPSIGDNTAVATISSFDATAIGFTNSYSTSLIPAPPNIVTSIPDNANPALITLTPKRADGTPLYGPGITAGLLPDYGPTTFSGQGVNINILTLSAVTNDAPFNITVNHTDNNGCRSVNTIQYTVYNHNTAINITTALIPDGGVTDPSNSYLASNNNFVVNQQTNSPTYGRPGHVRFVDWQNLSAFFLISLTADIPSGFPSQIINGTAWKTIINSLPEELSPTHTASNFKDYRFDDAKIADARALSGNVLLDPYENFKSSITSAATGQTLTYYGGGSLGFVDFTGNFQSRTNTAVKIPRVQRVEFWLPAVPVVDASLPSSVDTADPANLPGTGPAHNPGTLVYCEYGGLINITARPEAGPGKSGTFVLKSATGTPLVVPPGAFTDNTNGSAVLDPSKFSNGYADIMIEYTFRDLKAPLPTATETTIGTSYQIIRITPNPIADFTLNSAAGPNIENTALSFCKDNLINFDLTAGSSITAAPTGTPPNTLASYLWDFGDVNSVAGNEQTSTIATPSHKFSVAQNYQVTLKITSNWGCPSIPRTSPTQTTIVGAKTRTLPIGGIPLIKYKLDGVSTNDMFHFNSNERSVAFPSSGNFTSVTLADNTLVPNTTATGDRIAKYTWDFGDLSAPVDVTTPTTDDEFNRNVVTHQYTVAGPKQIDLTVTSTLGCVNKLSYDATRYRSLVVLARKDLNVIPPATTGSYATDFNANNGDWQVWGTGRTVAEMSTGQASATWEYGSLPAGYVVPANPDINASKVWGTSIVSGGTYKTLERSALYSPSLNLTQLRRPMISFNSVVQMAPSDGIVLEYSKDNLNIADPNKRWRTVGAIADGEDWYLSQGIAGRPGTQTANDFGWSGIDKTKWLSSRHVLDSVFTTPGTDYSKVVFRWALGSAAQILPPEAKGFAITNVRIGDRTRTILLESFASTSNTAALEKVNNDFIASFNPATLNNVNIGTEVVKINYHLGFPAKDPFNEDNPADPSSRALLYNITSTPKSVLDGEKDPQDRRASEWVSPLYNLRTLQLAQADIILDKPKPKFVNDSLQIYVKIVSTVSSGIPANTIIHVAVLEDNIPFGSLNDLQKSMVKSGENNFEFVMKKMLPSAAGTRMAAIHNNLPLAFNDSVRFRLSWVPETKKMFAPIGDLSIAVFLQQESKPYEIYQVEIIRNVQEPPVITGVEPIPAESVKVYPIPSNNEMNVLLPGVLKENANIQLIDQMGRVVYTSTISGGDDRKAINTESFASGVYIMQLEIGTGNFTYKKVMVVH